VRKDWPFVLRGAVAGDADHLLQGPLTVRRTTTVFRQSRVDRVMVRLDSVFRRDVPRSTVASREGEASLVLALEHPENIDRPGRIE
jgi:hypothetical protein